MDGPTLNGKAPAMASESNPVLRLNGAEAIVRLLRAAGIEQVFGIASGKLMPLIKALAAAPDLRFVGVRHEAAAAFMAAGAFAGTGRIAVCLGETAPGGLNLLSGMGTSFANNLPALAITSSHNSRLAAPSRGAFSAGDNERLFAPMVKWTTTVRDPARIPEVIHWALREAFSGRPGPVHLDIPADVLSGEADFDAKQLDAPLEAYVPGSRQGADTAAALAAVALIRPAERPLFVAGGGVIASGATEVFRALADRAGALAISTQMGLGAAPSTGAQFIGQGGILGGEASLRALREADVILAVGCRFSSWMWPDGPPVWGGRPDQKLVHLDIDPAVMGRNLRVDVGLVGDARTILEQMLGHFGPKAASLSAWSVDVLRTHALYRARLDALASAGDGPAMHPAAFAKAVGEVIGEDGLVVFDGGHTSFWSNDFTPTTAPRSRFHDPGMAQLGFGTPFALALQHAFPGQRVFNITGDGAFGFTLAELDTARRYGLNTINVIHNNAAWGVIRFAQQHGHGFSFGADLAGTDYAAIARAFGCFGERVSRVEDVKPAIERAIGSGLPAVIEGMVSFEPHPMLPIFGRSSA
jgi:thiamine pyrophosphate-dependent acetolactate synthase large subunit-like protein